MPDMFQSTDILITTVLEPCVYAQLAVQLHSDGVINLHQVTTEDSFSLDSWTNLQTRHNLWGMWCKWHKALQKWLCIDDTLSDSEDSIMGPGVLTMSQTTSLMVLLVPQTMMVTLTRS
ncbi:hypothetical protein BG005_004271, partial [Podila minutissima]